MWLPQHLPLSRGAFRKLAQSFFFFKWLPHWISQILLKFWAISICMCVFLCVFFSTTLKKNMFVCANHCCLIVLPHYHLWVDGCLCVCVFGGFNLSTGLCKGKILRSVQTIHHRNKEHNRIPQDCIQQQAKFCVINYAFDSFWIERVIHFIDLWVIRESYIWLICGS